MRKPSKDPTKRRRTELRKAGIGKPAAFAKRCETLAKLLLEIKKTDPADVRRIAKLLEMMGRITAELEIIKADGGEYIPAHHRGHR